MLKLIISRILSVAILCISLVPFHVQAMEDLFYLKANIGYYNLTSVNGLTSPTSKMIGGAVGYYVTDDMRADVTFTHFLIPLHKNTIYRMDGMISSLMLSAVVDLFDIDAVQIFAGGGIGSAKVKTKVSINADTSANGKWSTKPVYTYAYAFYLGGSYEIAASTHLELVYSYQDMGKTKRVPNLNNLPIKTPLYRSNNLILGLRIDL